MDAESAKVNLRKRRFDVSGSKKDQYKYDETADIDHVIVDGQLVEQLRPSSKLATKLDKAILKAKQIK